MSDGVKRRNDLVSDFIAKFARDVVADGGSFADIMTMTEGVMLAAMLLNVKQFKLGTDVASGLMEVALQRATERFANAIKEGWR